LSSKFLISKALDIRPDALGKSTFVVAKGLAVLALVALAGWSIWTSFIQPHTKYRVASTVQKAERITNNEFQSKKRHKIELFWGAVKLW